MNTIISDNKIYIKSFGDNPLAKVLAIIFENIMIASNPNLSCEIIENDELLPFDQNLILILSDKASENWNSMDMKMDSNDILFWNYPVIYFRFNKGMLRGGNDSEHPLGFLTKGAGSKSLVIDCPDDFNFDNDTGLIEIIKNWTHELWEE